MQAKRGSGNGVVLYQERGTESEECNSTRVVRQQEWTQLSEIREVEEGGGSVAEAIK